MTPARGLLLVTPVETAERFVGSRLVIPETARERLAALQCMVRAVGAPEACEDDACERTHVAGEHACPIRAGDWLLVRPRCFVDGPEPERREWFVRQADVLAIVRP